MPRKSKFTPEEKVISFCKVLEMMRKRQICADITAATSLAFQDGRIMENGIEGLKSKKQKEVKNVSLEEFQTMQNEKKQLEQTSSIGGVGSSAHRGR